MDHDVVIAGAGPTGLTLACELALRGVTPLVLERHEETDPTVKALAVHGRGVHTLDRLGVLARLGDMPTMAEMARRLPPGTTMPRGHFAGLWVLGEGSVPARDPIIAPQQRVEEALAERAAELGVPIRRGRTVTGYRETADGVTVTVHGPGGDTEVTAGWLVGCDGGRSRVRKLTGVAFPGTDGVMTGYQALAELDDPNFTDRGWNRTERGLMVLGGPPGAGTRVLVAEFDGAPEDRDAPVTAAELQAALRRVSGTTVTVNQMHTVTRFTDNARLAADYRVGRVLLAGDAAHVHAPFGGPGMNLGIGDAANLGWKLAATVTGTAPAGLLDTYSTERRPVAERVLRNARAQVALLRSGPHVDALREVFTALAETDEANRLLTDSMADLDLRYGPAGTDPLQGRYRPELTVHTADGPVAVADAERAGHALLLDLTGTAVPDTAGWADRIDTLTAAAPDPDRPADALLVRPDGYVAWVAPRDGKPGTPLPDALTRWFGAPLAASSRPARTA